MKTIHSFWEILVLWLDDSTTAQYRPVIQRCFVIATEMNLSQVRQVISLKAELKGQKPTVDKKTVQLQAYNQDKELCGN